MTGRLMLDLDGKQLTKDEKMLLDHACVGGVILFTRNIESPQQVKALTDEIRSQRPELMIAVDQEGGRVQRLIAGFTRLPPLASLGALYKMDAPRSIEVTQELAWLMAIEVRSVGIDFSFAPVLDIDYANSAVIGDRAFSDEPGAIVALAKAYLHGMHSAGMASVGKHFPGHGYVAADSHHALPVDERCEEAVMQDAAIFSKLIQEGLDGIMPAHVLYSNVDALPAGFSPYWIETVLRKQLGYAGTVFSDDLKMAGAKSIGSYAKRIEKALDAGCDMVLICNDRQGVLEAIDWFSHHQTFATSERLTHFLREPIGEVSKSAFGHAAGSDRTIDKTEAAQLAIDELLIDSLQPDTRKLVKARTYARCLTEGELSKLLSIA